MKGLNSILNWSVRVGKLFGIPISLHITIIFFLLPALRFVSSLGFWVSVEFAALIVLSILCHELGHALTAKRFGLTGLSIMLHGFGGFATSQGNRKPKQQLLIVLAGPAVTFALGIVLLEIGMFGLQRPSIGLEASIQFAMLHYLGVLNIWMGFLNLIPMFPFDGGQAVAAVLSFRIPEFKATRHVAHLGLILGPVLAIFGFIKNYEFLELFGLLGLLFSFLHLRNTGGVRFTEVLDDRKRRKEEEAFRRRSHAKNDAYLDEVTARSIERQEQERLRRLIE